MIETLLISFTGTQLIIQLVVTVMGGFGVGVIAYAPTEIAIGCGVVIFIQIALFWTSAHLEMILYGHESGISNINPDLYVLLHHGVQLGILWASFAAGRAYAFGTSR